MNFKPNKYEFQCFNCGAILNNGIIICPYCKFRFSFANKKDNKNLSLKNNNNFDFKKPASKNTERSPVNGIEVLITSFLIITIIAMLVYNHYSVNQFNSKISKRIERHGI